MRTKTGLSTEAVYIFHNMVRKLVTSYKPDYIAAIFESSEPTFRSESFAEYKANRTEMPHDLGEQIPHIRRILEAMHASTDEAPAASAHCSTPQWICGDTVAQLTNNFPRALTNRLSAPV